MFLLNLSYSLPVVLLLLMVVMYVPDLFVSVTVSQQLKAVVVVVVERSSFVYFHSTLYIFMFCIVLSYIL